MPQRLDPEHRARLDEDGYTVFPAVLDPALVARIGARVDELADAEGPLAGAEQHQEPGCVRVADLVNKDPLFDLLWTHPLLLAAADHVLRGRPFKVSSLAARDVLLGGGLQPLHADWPLAVSPDDAQVVNSAWMIDPFTDGNGATRVVPGTHRHPGYPYQELAELTAPHPRERLVVGPAGSLAVFSSHVWHGGTRNVSGARRRSIFAYFTRLENPPMLDQARFLRPETAARLDEAQRRLLLGV